MAQSGPVFAGRDALDCLDVVGCANHAQSPRVCRRGTVLGGWKTDPYRIEHAARRAIVCWADLDAGRFPAEATFILPKGSLLLAPFARNREIVEK